jgi:signal transduction histidine kinase
MTQTIASIDPAVQSEPSTSLERLRTEGRQRIGDDSWDLIGSNDRLVPFGQAILAVRWSTTMVSIALAADAFITADLGVVAWVVVVLANTVIRTISPLEYTGSTRSLVNLVLEIALHVLALAATGYWHSPLVFSLVNAVMLAGFARGFGFAIRIGAAAAIAVTLPGLETAGWTRDSFTFAGQWTTVVILVGIIAGYARRISGEATRQHSIAIGRLNALADANALLFNLHRIAQTLPASLDQNEVLDSTLVRLRGLIDFDSACILIIDETDGSWIVARRQAMSLGQILHEEELPDPARLAVTSRAVGLSGDLSTDGPGFNQGSRSGIYAPLFARGALIGLLSVEGRDSGAFEARDQQVMQSFIEPVALAIDNSRWFSRLRTVGADEERTRIARDLHDRIGQSLAYLGFELDRVVRQNEQGVELSDSLSDLRRDLRGVTSEVRDTLYDLRTDVGNEKDFAATIEEFAGRVAERSNLVIELNCDEGARLPILQEREMWRIAQEALVNIERHAEAQSVSVSWRCNGADAVLEIVDDGRGFPVGKTGRQDSYGILGMRERASSIGATLELSSSPGEGTTVQCNLAQG